MRGGVTLGVMHPLREIDDERASAREAAVRNRSASSTTRGCASPSRTTSAR
jgi:hypothetical protein